ARPRVGVDALEDRRIVGQIEQAAEGIDRARSARQVTVVLLLTRDHAELQGMGAGGLTQRVAEFKNVLRKDAGRALTLSRAESDAAPYRQAFDFDARNAEIDIGGVRSLIDLESRRIESLR